MKVLNPEHAPATLPVSKLALFALLRERPHALPRRRAEPRVRPDHRQGDGYELLRLRLVYPLGHEAV